MPRPANLSYIPTRNFPAHAISFLPVEDTGPAAWTNLFPVLHFTLDSAGFWGSWPLPKRLGLTKAQPSRALVSHRYTPR